MSLKVKNGNMEFPLLIKLSLQNDSEKKQPLSWPIAINLKNVRTSFPDYPNAIHFILVHLCASMLLFLFFLCCPNGNYCNVSFYFLGILGVMKFLSS